MSLAVAGISVRIDGKSIVNSVQFTVPLHGIVALVGPNGSGKSTLLRLLSGVQKADGGDVSFDGQRLLPMSRRDRARLVALVEQDSHSEFPLTVRQTVELGRIPFQSIWAGGNDADRSIVDDAFEVTGTKEFAARPISTLSGGERQRVHLARALAQQPRLLMLDEPTNHLDIRAQLSTLRLLRRLADQGLTVLAALHDLNLASAHCDHVIALKDGQVHAVGTVEDVLQPVLIEEIYGVSADVLVHPQTGRPLIAFSESAACP